MIPIVISIVRIFVKKTGNIRHNTLALTQNCNV